MICSVAMYLLSKTRIAYRWSPLRYRARPSPLRSEIAPRSRPRTGKNELALADAVAGAAPLRRRRPAKDLPASRSERGDRVRRELHRATGELVPERRVDDRTFLVQLGDLSIDIVEMVVVRVDQLGELLVSGLVHRSRISHMLSCSPGSLTLHNTGAPCARNQLRRTGRKERFSLRCT